MEGGLEAALPPVEADTEVAPGLEMEPVGDDYQAMEE